MVREDLQTTSHTRHLKVMEGDSQGIPTEEGAKVIPIPKGSPEE